MEDFFPEYSHISIGILRLEPKYVGILDEF